MKDGPEEISGVLNLLLPLDNLLPLDDKFKAEFFNTNENGIMTIKPSMMQRLKDTIRGRVSFLGELQGDVQKEFVGRPIGNLRHFHVEPLRMSDFQTEHYNLAFEKDYVEKGIYSNARQASLFVFPNGTYGTEGFEKFIVKKENRRLSAKENKKFYSYALSRELMNEFTQLSNEEKLSALRKFSVKYAFTIESLLDAKNKGKLSFVYSEFVQGSGIILFIKLLELFGFSRAIGTETTKALRYAVITNQTTTIREIKNVIKRYNKSDNMNGDYISVIIGSEVISEGYSLRNVQEEHILTPYWNYSEISQAISRGIRAGSHRDLIENGIMPIVRIHQLVSIPANTKITSIDLRMYEISEIKDINIKHVERLIKETAYDCALTYDRNHVTGKNGERECDYMSCDYICDGVTMTKRMDNSTYQLYYSEKEVRDIIKAIVLLFENNFALNLVEIVNHLHEIKKYTMFNILNALEQIIFKNVRIYNKYGFVSYLREENNIYFLTDNVTAQNRLFSEYYTRLPNIKANSKLFEDILNDIEARNYASVIEKIFEVEREEELLYLINRLSDDAKEILLEGCLFSLIKGTVKNARIRDRILFLFKENYQQINGVYVSTLLYAKEGILRCLQNDVWTNCSEEYATRVENIREEQTRKLEKNEYGYYGLYNPKEKKFCIRDVSVPELAKVEDKRKKRVGAVCETWKRPTLVRIASVKFKIDIPTDAPENRLLVKEVQEEIRTNKYIEDIIKECEAEKIKLSFDDMKRILYWSKIPRKEMCEKMRMWFEQNGLLVEDFDCGVQTKKR